MIIKKQRLLLLNLCLLAHLCQAAPQSVGQTKTKLGELQIKINTLTHTLVLAHDKHKILDKELAKTEKNISNSIRDLHAIQIKIQASVTKISTLETQIQALNIQLAKAQQALLQHLRARYKVGEYQPLKWLLNQDRKDTSSRLLTYHEYVLKQRQTIISQITQTKVTLQSNQNLLNQELETHKRLENTLNQHQLALSRDKQYHKVLIQSLEKDIQNKQQTIAEYKQNQANLSRILAALIQEQNKPRTSFPIFRLNSKFAMPVDNRKPSMQKINQGVMLFATEGSRVNAALAGKVVFNDWLKGYGLLLIIDHGHGLMTLYAHNQSLFKQRGDMVLKGEQIATVGHSGTMKQNGLYFEVRRGGKAVSPMAWLT